MLELHRSPDRTGFGSLTHLPPGGGYGVGVNTKARWAESFRETAFALVARHLGRDDYRRLIRTQSCLQHHGECVKVIFGVLLRHVAWQATDPIALAEEVVRNMLPPEEQHRVVAAGRRGGSPGIMKHG
jgi:hypothetical protein